MIPSTRCRFQRSPRPMIYRLLAVVILLVPGAALYAQDRETKVRSDRDQLKENETWIYNDLDKGFEEAKRTGKPLMVTLRCIPCEACSRFDKKLLDRQNEVRDRSEERRVGKESRSRRS